MLRREESTAQTARISKGGEPSLAIPPFSMTQVIVHLPGRPQPPR